MLDNYDVYIFNKNEINQEVNARTRSHEVSKIPTDFTLVKYLLSFSSAYRTGKVIQFVKVKLESIQW